MLGKRAHARISAGGGCTTVSRENPPAGKPLCKPPGGGCRAVRDLAGDDSATALGCGTRVVREGAAKGPAARWRAPSLWDLKGCLWLGLVAHIRRGFGRGGRTNAGRRSWTE